MISVLRSKAFPAGVQTSNQVGPMGAGTVNQRDRAMLGCRITQSVQSRVGGYEE